MTDLRIERLIGPQVQPYLPDVARLRIEVFREFPYLYDGDMEYEQHYLATYSASPASLFVLVWDGDTIVGTSTGVPMEDETDEFKQPFLDNAYDPARIFYFGESVLQRDYRGQGVGVRFFHEREDYARSMGRFRYTTFCAVERPADHPRRPAAYVSLDAFWQRRGYTRHTELHTEYTWRDLDETSESPKPMIFWLKAL
ncbi:MAG: GNAT family N-acetyltransferase [Chloroflexaceae bacterium]|nr:GNAT family N-acetyltransferase [Chloroflexaceae bacterium]